MGLLAGLWAVLWVGRWLGVHWQGVQPALAYTVLRWIVAGLAGLAVSALLQLWGNHLGRAVRATPVGWVDRGGGVAIGAAIGLLTVALAVMGTLLMPGPRGLTGQVARSHAVVPLMAGAARVCSLSVRILPAGPWLEARFQQAHRRAEQARQSDHTQSRES
jgi:hypothetical protein